MDWHVDLVRVIPSGSPTGAFPGIGRNKQQRRLRVRQGIPHWLRCQFTACSSAVRTGPGEYPNSRAAFA